MYVNGTIICFVCVVMILLCFCCGVIVADIVGVVVMSIAAIMYGVNVVAVGVGVDVVVACCCAAV